MVCNGKVCYRKKALYKWGIKQGLGFVNVFIDHDDGGCSFAWNVGVHITDYVTDVTAPKTCILHSLENLISNSGCTWTLKENSVHWYVRLTCMFSDFLYVHTFTSFIFCLYFYVRMYLHMWNYIYFYCCRVHRTDCWSRMAKLWMKMEWLTMMSM